MNRIAILFTLFGLFTVKGFQAIAQDNPDESREKIKALKVAFFTEQLNLTAAEATTFWPIYNSYEAEKEEIMNSKRKDVFEKIGENAKYSESEAKAIYARYRELETRENNLDQRFQNKMTSTFSASRTLKLFRAEHEFRKRLLREYRRRNGNNP
jgi:hypothetical protein